MLYFILTAAVIVFSVHFSVLITHKTLPQMRYFQKAIFLTINALYVTYRNLGLTVKTFMRFLFKSNSVLLKILLIKES